MKDTLLDLTKSAGADNLKERAHGHAAAREPEGNPIPIAFMECWDDQLDMIAIDPAYMRDPETKENLLVFLRTHIRRNRAQAVCLMCPVWMARTTQAPGADKIDMDAIRDRLPKNLADAPGATEFLMIWHVTQFKREIWNAPITRHEDGPPTLGEWVQPYTDFNLGDRFGARLQQSVIAVA